MTRLIIDRMTLENLQKTQHIHKRIHNQQDYNFISIIIINEICIYFNSVMF